MLDGIIFIGIFVSVIGALYYGLRILLILLRIPIVWLFIAVIAVILVIISAVSSGRGSPIATTLISHGSHLDRDTFRVVYNLSNTDNVSHSVNAIVGMRFASPNWSNNDVAGYGDGGNSVCINDYLNPMAKSYCWNDDQHAITIPARSTVQIIFTLKGVNTMYSVPERLYNTPIEPTQICIALYRIDSEPDPYDRRVAMEQNSKCQ